MKWYIYYSQQVSKIYIYTHHIIEWKSKLHYGMYSMTKPFYIYIFFVRVTSYQSVNDIHLWRVGFGMKTKFIFKQIWYLLNYFYYDYNHFCSIN